MRDTLLIIHILAAATWFGGSMTVSFYLNRIRKKGNAAGTAFLQVFGKMGRLYFPPAAAVILVTGILLVVDSDVWAFEDPFVVVGIAAVLAGAFLGTRIFDPISKQAIDAHESDDKAGVRRAYRRFGAFGFLDIVIVGFAIVSMVTKLGT